MPAFGGKTDIARDDDLAHFDVAVDYLYMRRVADGGASPGAAGVMANE